MCALTNIMVGFKWNTDAGVIAWVSPFAKQPRLYFNPKYWRQYRGYNWWVQWANGINKHNFDITEEDLKYYRMQIEFAEHDINEVPDTISHETLHLVLQAIAPWEKGQEVSASHGLDARQIFGYACENSASGIDWEVLDDYLQSHIPIPLPDLTLKCK